MQQPVPVQNVSFQPNYFAPYPTGAPPPKPRNPGLYENGFVPRYGNFSIQREMLDLKKLIENANKLKENEADQSPYCARWHGVSDPFPSIWKFTENELACVKQQTVVVEETAPIPPAQPVMPNFMPQKSVSELRPSPSPPPAPNQYQFQPQRQIPPRTSFSPQSIDSTYSDVPKAPQVYAGARSDSPEYSEGPRSRRGQKPQRKNRPKKSTSQGSPWVYRSDP